MSRHAAAAQTNTLGSNTRASDADVVVEVMLYVQNCTGKKQVQNGMCYKHREENSFLKIGFG